MKNAYFYIQMYPVMPKVKASLILVLFLILSALNPRLYAQQHMIDSLVQELQSSEGTDRLKTLIQLSGLHSRISLDKSIRYASQALELAREMEDQRGEAIALNLLGVGYSNSKPEKALNYYIRSLDIFEEMGENQSVGLISNNIGIIYHDMGKYSEAIYYYEKSLSTAKKLDNEEGIAFALNNLGTVYNDWKKYETALDYLIESLTYYEKTRDTAKIAIVLNNIGEVNSQLKNYDKALHNYQRSLEINERLGTVKGIIYSHKNIGSIEKSLGKYHSALTHLTQALALCKTAGDKASEVYLLINLGEVHLRLGNNSKAFDYLRQGLIEAKEIKSTRLEKDATKLLSEYYQATGNFEKALEYYKQHTIAKDTLFNQESRQEIAELQTIYETEKKENEIQLLTKNAKIRELELQKQKNQKYYIAFFSLFLLTLAFLIFNRYRFKQKQYRTELEKKNIETEQRLLRTQMNPHFIFNSLNSINSFITDNEPGSAQTFLTKFAQLMRYILENSTKSMIPLEDEINTLRLNLELERLRFSNKFDFNIELDDNLDEEFTYIPPMLIQPFIENAVLHGVIHKTEKGNISLEFKPKSDTLECIIEDDGIGREKAQAIKSKKGGTKHRSLGMQLTRERLDSFNTKKKQLYYYKIEDLKDDNGNPSGTRVELAIPYESE